jgi:hypothetical protein
VTPVQVVVEGVIDDAVARRTLAHFGIAVERSHTKGGRSKIEARVGGYYRASQYSPWLVLADLDNDCASDLLERWRVPTSDAAFLCRFVTREIESWILADREGAARNLAVSLDSIPIDPDALTDPKRALVAIAKRSRKRAVRDDILPIVGGSSETGPGYNLRLSEFARDSWDVCNASKYSRSLARYLSALEAFSIRI